MIEQTNNRTIAKNTLYLYFRMIIILVVTLYTSRVILKILGIDDYGIYQAVGGVVGLLSFISGALSTGSARFLTFELGTGNEKRLRDTFSTTLMINIVLALIIVLLLETVGLWFLYNKLLIDPSRMNAAVYVFHLSALTVFFKLTQVPYNASIISHEKMAIYAYMSIIEVSAKLAIVYLLTVGDFDKLKFYATLLCFVQICIMLFYRFYCVQHFKETKYRFIFDRSIFKSIASFSGWSLISNASRALNNQGILILINMFFFPAVVAARAISIQVNMAANQFVNNFRLAVSPQIVKQYAAENLEGSKKLLLSSTKYSYYLMLLLSLPICILAEPLLNLWLTEVPKYTVIFLQIIMIQSLFQVFDTSFYTALYAKGQLRENALISPVIVFLIFPIVYILFKLGYSPVSLSWASLIAYVILALVVKPILIIKIANYTWKEIMNVYIPCLWVTICAIPIPILVSYLIDTSKILGFLTSGMITIICVTASIYYIGLDKKMRHKLLNEILSRIKGKRKVN